MWWHVMCGEVQNEPMQWANAMSQSGKTQIKENCTKLVGNMSLTAYVPRESWHVYYKLWEILLYTRIFSGPLSCLLIFLTLALISLSLFTVVAQNVGRQHHNVIFHFIPNSFALLLPLVFVNIKVPSFLLPWEIWETLVDCFWAGRACLFCKQVPHICSFSYILFALL